MADRPLVSPSSHFTSAFIPHNFSVQAQHTPNQPAISFAGHTTTYKDLEQQANQLAYFLIQAGIGAEQRVGLFFDRSPLMIIAMLAVFKAGAAYVPFDPAQPQARNLELMRDADLAMLFTHTPVRAALPQIACPSILLDHWEQFAQLPTIAPQIELSLDQLAYIIYTSGSTGQPKGVLVTHRGLMNLVESQILAFGLNAESRVLQFAPITFDASVSEIWTTLLAGATLYLVYAYQVLPGADLRHVLVDNAITMVTLPPSVLAVLEPADFPALKTIVSAGEACTLDLVARWETGERTLINAYGPTEITVCATMALDVMHYDTVSIGMPIANTTVYLVDENLQQISDVDRIGEILVSGPGVARGYNNQPELTASRFLNDPFNPDSAYRVYRTGDLARWLPDGNLEYIGRIDSQIKLRGFRIEPGEIEHVLCLFPQVRQAVVTVQTDSNDNERLVAYLLSADNTLNSSSIRAYLKGLLPNYMIPSAFVVVEQFSLTSSGKVDTTDLPKADFGTMHRDMPYVMPQTELEQSITAIWEEVLELKPIGIYDNFFDIGGHSLLATRVMALIRQRLNIEIPLSALLSVEPTILATAQIVEEYMLNQVAPDELEALLAELDGLSDEEVQALLAESEGAIP